MSKCACCKNELIGKRSGFCSFYCQVKNKIKVCENGCWETGVKPRKDGYINFVFNEIQYLAHRLSFLHFNGQIHGELLVCHTCDNRACINPDHLYLGTHSQNALDRQRRNKNSNQSGQNNRNAKLSKDQVVEIRKEYCEFRDFNSISQKYGISKVYVRDLINGRRWKCLEMETSKG